MDQVKYADSLIASGNLHDFTIWISYVRVDKSPCIQEVSEYFQFGSAVLRPHLRLKGIDDRVLFSTMKGELSTHEYGN